MSTTFKVRLAARKMRIKTARKARIKAAARELSCALATLFFTSLLAVWMARAALGYEFEVIPYAERIWITLIN